MTEYLEQGAGRPALILHGGGGPFTVAPLTAHLSQTMHTITPTHPGWNGTELPDSIASIADLAALYRDFLIERDLRDVLLVGNSVGGWIALELAALDAGDRVSGVVAINSTGIRVDAEPMVDFFSLTPRGVAEHSFADPDRFFVDPSTFPPERVAAQRGNMASLRTLAGEPYMHDPTLEGRLGAMAIPTLVLWGDSDRIVTPAYGRVMAEAIGNARFELIDNAGHLPQIEKPEATFAAIDRFVAAEQQATSR